MPAAVIILLILAWVSVVTVPAGHVGVVDLFGHVYDKPLTPGLHFINPFAQVHPVSSRVEIITVEEDVPTKEGLAVHLQAAALYRLEPSMAVQMYKTVGMSALDSIVAANFHAVVREITSGHEAKDLYTSKTRLAMTSDLRGALAESLKDRGVVVEDTPLKKLELPTALQHSIEDKLLAEQLSEQMQFVLQKERQEAERKRIQASGISKFQDIVSGGISSGLLRWKGIEATEMLAQSPNPKTVVIGASDGMPIILGAEEYPTDQPPPKHAPQALPMGNSQFHVSPDGQVHKPRHK